MRPHDKASYGSLNRHQVRLAGLPLPGEPRSYLTAFWPASRTIDLPDAVTQWRALIGRSFLSPSAREAYLSVLDDRMERMGL